MKLKARNPHASRTERACPRTAPLLGAPGQRCERRKAAALAWQDTSLRCVRAKGFLRAVSLMGLLLLGCHSVQEIQIETSL